MAGTIWVVAETNADGSLAKISSEIATLARSIADAAGSSAAGIVVAPEPGPAAEELATFLPRVVSVTEPTAAEHAWAQIAAQRAAAILTAETPGAVMTGAGSDGRDVAGTLVALLERGVLYNAVAVSWDAERGGPAVEMGVFGGRLITTSAFSDGAWGIVTVRPNVVTAEAAGSPGSVEVASPAGELSLPAVKIVERIEEAAGAVSIEDARVIVAGGRGVASEAGFGLLQELADELGGAVGATRAAVDAGWIPYAQQIGQTGKIVKPQLYLAMGISGAIQHKVGMQTSGTIVAINRDPDAPIAEFADLLVVGDQAEVGRALLEALRSRA